MGLEEEHGLTGDLASAPGVAPVVDLVGGEVTIDSLVRVALDDPADRAWRESDGEPLEYSARLGGGYNTVVHEPVGRWPFFRPRSGENRRTGSDVLRYPSV